MKYLAIIVFALIALDALAQDNIGQNYTDQDDRFLLGSMGMVIPVYRDFATSPLFYRGAGLHGGMGWMRSSDKRERLIDFNMNGSLTLARTPESDFFPALTEGFFISINSQFHYLYKIERFSTAKNNFKLGGAIVSTQNIRINPHLENAAVGLENISNLMLVGKLKRDISRTEPKNFKFLFIKTTLQPIRRYLDFQTNIGILNFNRRPGYAYVYHNEWDGTDTDPASWVLDAYRWTLNGWRLGTTVEYSWFRPSGNGRKISYLWDAAHAPGRFESMQMASHTFRYTIIINNNKR
ncbi:MAG TPA: hypothetical protein VK921_01955 [Anditalea sp.]|nr:hypothetical protein [Anditalea sp.]